MQLSLPCPGLRRNMGRCCRMVVAAVTYPCPGPSHPDRTRVLVAGWLLLLLLTPVQDPVTQTGHGSLLQDGCCCCYLPLSRTQPPRRDTGRCYRMVVAVVTYPCPGPSHPDGTRVVVTGLCENLRVRVAVTIRHYRPVYVQALSFSVLSATSTGRRTLKGTTVRVHMNIDKDRKIAL